MRRYTVYLLASTRRTLYCGVTSDLEKRVREHKAGIGSDFTRRYHVHRLVWLQEFGEVLDAIACEKQIKGWARAKKVRLIERENPEWRDLAEEA